MRYFFKKFSFLVLVAGALFIVSAASAQAQGIVPAECVGAGAVELCRACSFFKLIDNIFNLILTRVVPPLAVILIAIGGFLYLVSGDSEQRRTPARGILTWTLVGLVLVYASFILLHTVLTVLAGDRVDVESVFLMTSRNFEISCRIPPPPPPSPSPSPPPPPPAAPTVSAAHTAAALAATRFAVFDISGECGDGVEPVSPDFNRAEVASGRQISSCSSACNRNGGCGGVGGGGFVTPSLRLLESFPQIQSHCGVYRVTSMAGGRHASGSAHYAGMAMDIKPNAGSWDTCLQRIKNLVPGVDTSAGTAGTFCDVGGQEVSCATASQAQTGHIHIRFNQ
jgi:hypothetical protein